MLSRICSVAAVLACTAASLASVAATAAPPPLAVAWNDAGGGGRVRLLDTVSPWPFLTSPLPVGASSNLRYAGDRLYAVSPNESTVTAIAIEPWGIEQVYAIPGSSWPVDIQVVASDRAYVTRRDSAQLLRLDLATAATLEVLDLGGFDHPAGIVQIGMMAAHADRLLVQVAIFDAGAAPTALPAAYLAVVDVASEQLVDVDPATPGIQAIELVGTPAKHKMQIDEAARDLFVSASGTFFDEGGLERVDLETLQSTGLVVAEADGNVAADLGSFVLVRPDRGYLVFSTDLLPSSHLHDFTLADGAIPIPEYHTAVDYRVPTMVHETSTDTFFLPEGGNGGDGVHVFDASSGQRLTDRILATNGTPTDVVLLCEESGCGVCGPQGCRGLPAVSDWGLVALALLLAAGGAAPILARSSRLRNNPDRAGA